MKAGIPINALNMTSLLEHLHSSGPKFIGFMRLNEATIEQCFTLILAKILI